MKRGRMQTRERVLEKRGNGEGSNSLSKENLR